MTVYYVTDATIAWPASTVVSLGDRVYGSAVTSVVFECTTAGTNTNDTEPTWDTTPGNTTADNNGAGPGDVVWTARATGTGGNYDNAAPTLAFLETAKAPYTADDEIHLGHDHAESTAGALTFAFANGTEVQPIRVISTNTTTDVYEVGASITSTGNNNINVSSGASVWYGVNFVPGNDFGLSGANTVHKFFDCTINAVDRPMNMTGAEITGELFDCSVISSDAAAPAMLVRSECTLLVRGGSITMASASSAEDIIELLGDGVSAIIEDCDLSGCTSDMVLGLFNSTGSNRQIVYRRCKLPSSYAMPAAAAGSNKVQVESCSGSTGTVPFLGITEWKDIIGSTKAVTAQNRDTGASDGVNDFSWEMNPNTNVSYFSPLESPPITYWAVPGAQTVTIHIANDVDLTDAQFWIVVEHPDTASPANPDHIVLSTRPAPLATGSTITRDADSIWNGAGTGTDGSTGQQKVTSSSFNPIEAGPVIIRMYLAVDDTMYVDPEPQVA